MHIDRHNLHLARLLRLCAKRHEILVAIVLLQPYCFVFVSNTQVFFRNMYAIATYLRHLLLLRQRLILLRLVV